MSRAWGRCCARRRLEFADLNHDEVSLVPNRLRFTDMEQLALPATLRRADLIVSLPKMKTHHWAGVTLSMKNLFGVMPGVYYGWPKNVLHHAGIPGSILDINAAVRPHLAIVDGIIGMEGDGPIMGTPRAAGVLVMGTNLPAVDATAARLMGIDPWRIAYLAAASGRLGPIAARHIAQRGEPIAAHAQDFRLLDQASRRATPRAGLKGFSQSGRKDDPISPLSPKEPLRPTPQGLLSCRERRGFSDSGKSARRGPNTKGCPRTVWQRHGTPQIVR